MHKYKTYKITEKVILLILDMIREQSAIYKITINVSLTKITVKALGVFNLAVTLK